MLQASAKVVAVIVSYQPGNSIGLLVGALMDQVWRIIIVDNGSLPALLDPVRRLQSNTVALIELDKNCGIAYGHNRGIAWAKNRNATHVLLLDQDSFPEAAMVSKLLNAEACLLREGHRVGAIGPVYHDNRLNKSWPAYQLTRFGVRAISCEDRSLGLHNAIPCDLLISSGTLIQIPVLDRIGPMHEGFFLEHVDTEWSLRARHLGYQLFLSCEARMAHSLGDAAIRVPFVNVRVQVYEPYRYYYLFRNAVLLSRMAHAVLPWKLNEMRRLVMRVIFFSLLIPPRWQRLRMMLLGLCHGLIGKSGPLSKSLRPSG